MKKSKILLVDDVALFIQLEKSFLSRDLFEISTARSGKETLNSVRTNPPDLVLLDLYMPDMNGDAVCREIKNDPATKDVFIIIVSSEGEKNAERLCRQAGCDDFIYKPIRRDLLLAAVERQLKVTHRRHIRIHADLPCSVRLDDQITDGRIRSLSQSGAFVEMGFEPDLQTSLTIILKIPASENVLELTASVMWTGEQEGATFPGAGVEFSDVDASCVAMIRKYVESVLEEQIVS